MLEEFSERFKNADLGEIKAFKGACLDGLNKITSETKKGKNEAFNLQFELYRATTRRENELFKQTNTNGEAINNGKS